MCTTNYLFTRPALYGDKQGVFSYYNLPTTGPHSKNIKSLDYLFYLLLILFLLL